MTKPGLAVVGIAEVPTRRDPERTRWNILLDVCMGAINDAGIDKNLIGAVISNNPMAQPSMQNDMSLGKIPEVMGLKGCRDIAICNAGGASTTNCLRLAEQHIASGQVDFVLIPHTTVQSDMPPQDLINFFATAPLDKQFEYPYGVSFNGSMGLITQRYMYETGATRRGTRVSHRCAPCLGGARSAFHFLWQDCVAGGCDELARDQHPAKGQRSAICLADGGGAMVVTSWEKQKSLATKPVYNVGSWHAVYERHTHAARGCVSIGSPTANRVRMPWRRRVCRYTIWISGRSMAPTPTPNAVHWRVTACARTARAPNSGPRAAAAPAGILPAPRMGDATGRGHTGTGVAWRFIWTLSASCAVRRVSGRCRIASTPSSQPRGFCHEYLYHRLREGPAMSEYKKPLPEIQPYSQAFLGRHPRAQITGAAL